MGSSGCGKSTTLSLLLRFYDPQRGAITIDGHGVGDLDQVWLPPHISPYLPTSPHISPHLPTPPWAK